MFTLNGNTLQENHPFSTAFKLCFKEIFAKGENRLSSFLQRQNVIQRAVAFPFASLSQSWAPAPYEDMVDHLSRFLSPILWQWPMIGSDRSSNLVRFNPIFSEVILSCAF
jgi:hypothetical protein